MASLIWPALSCETLQGEILGATPRVGLNSSGTDVICNEKGIDPVIFPQAGKGFPVIRNRFRIEAENLNIIGFELVAGGKIIGHMDTIEKLVDSRGDQEISELRISLKDRKDHRFHSFYTAGSIRNRAHVDEAVGIKVQGSDKVAAGNRYQGRHKALKGDRISDVSSR